MRHLLTVILTCFTVAGAFGQGILTSVYPTSAFQGQQVTLLITGSGTSFSAATEAGIYGTYPEYYRDAFPPAQSNTVLNATFNIPNNATPGLYDVDVRSLSFFVTPLSNAFRVDTVTPGTGLITGKVVEEVLTNCIENFNDTRLSNVVVKITPGPYYAVSNNNGFWCAQVPAGNYTVELEVPAHHTLTCPATPYNVTVNSGQTVGNRDFYVDLQPVVDVEGCVMTNIHRPGFTTTNYVQVDNHGGGNANNVVVKTVIPPTFTYVSSNPPVTSIVGDTLTWNLGIVGGNSTQNLLFSVTTPANTPLNTTVPYSSSITTSSNDVNTANNSCHTVIQVQGSYDPNDKRVWTENGDIADGRISPTDSLLRYHIRFQNTGNDTAFNIFIRDTLDPNIDPGSIKVTQASHNYYMTIDSNKFIEWYFPNILLLDSFANEPLSHGYIVYTAKLNPNLPVGTEIDNAAGIYFDFNQPIQTNTVTSKICPPMEVGFSSTVNNTTVVLTDTSSGTISSWLWDFGDGNTSTLQSPTHTYATPGTYFICLTVGDTCGTLSACQPVLTSCATAPGFTFTTSGLLTANFTDASTTGDTITAWLWDFGDGTTSTAPNPSHTYAMPGTYNVCVTITDGCTTDSICQPVMVSCAAPNALYTGSTNLLTVTLTDLSTASTTITSWFWDFGDGNTSTQQNPVHTYATGGVYSICLTVTDTCGSDIFCNVVTVTCPLPSAQFTDSTSQLTAFFTDGSFTSAGISSWAWDFGDGNSSTQQNPFHVYSAPGTYHVCLTITDACGTSTACDSMTVSCAPPTAGFSHLATGLSVDFTDQSSGAGVSAWNWDFGDGNSSSQQNPNHVYALPGTYTVCLSVTDNCGTDSSCQTFAVDTLVAITPGMLGDLLQVYPVPASEQLHVDLVLPLEADVQLRVYDAMGREVFRSTPAYQQQVRHSISVAEWAEGLYFLELRVNQHRRMKTIEVQR